MPSPHDEAEQIFQEACDRPEDQRGAFVSARCAGNDALRAEVETLLFHEHAADEQFLAGGKPEAISLDEVGPTVGPYRIIRRIGEGGFGSVFLAEQHAPIRRQLAIKVVKLGMDTRGIIRRFETERQTLALMSHPSIARVIDAGVTNRGRPYFVMEYVPGPPVTDFCDAQCMTVAERIRLFQEACAAIEHAHHKGVIHRDIKPANILVDTVDGRPVLKVIDFGIAKAMGATGLAHATGTAAGGFLGTPGYSSPEQHAPNGDVDTRSDIYSLGVLLYVLLSSALPTDNPLDVRSGHGSAHHVGILPPSARVASLGAAAAPVAARRGTDPRALVRSLRGDLDWITMKAMEPDRSRRYSSCSELSADLRRCLTGEPILARPPSLAYRIRKFAGRHRGAVAGAAATMAVLSAGVAGIAWQTVRALRAEAVASQERDAARLETLRASAVVDFLRDMLREAAPQRAGSSTLTVREALDRAAARLADGALVDQPEVEDAVRWVIGQTYVWLGARQQAAAQFEWLAAHRQGSRDRLDPAIADALYWLGAELSALGQTGRARAFLERAAGIYAQAGPGVYSAQHVDLSLAEVQLLQDDPQGARERLKPLLEAMEAAGGAGRGEYAWAVYMLARTHLALGEEAMAAETFERARGLVEAAFDTASLHRLLFSRKYASIALIPAGRYQEVVDLAEPLVASISHAYAADHHDLLTLRATLAQALTETGRAPDAETILRDIIAIRERTGPGTEINLIVARSLLGHALAAMQRHAEAENLLVGALADLEQHHPGRRGPRADCLDRLVTFYERTARDDDAQVYRARRR